MTSLEQCMYMMNIAIKTSLHKHIVKWVVTMCSCLSLQLAQNGNEKFVVKLDNHKHRVTSEYYFIYSIKIVILQLLWGVITRQYVLESLANVIGVNKTSRKSNYTRIMNSSFADDRFRLLIFHEESVELADPTIYLRIFIIRNLLNVVA